jgi:hypothetical protein
MKYMSRTCSRVMAFDFGFVFDWLMAIRVFPSCGEFVIGKKLRRHGMKNQPFVPPGLAQFSTRCARHIVHPAICSARSSAG